jgi:hypothetical protein
MVNLRVSLSPQEADALAKLAYSQLREPANQLRWLLQQALRQQLKANNPTIEQKETEARQNEPT